MRYLLFFATGIFSVSYFSQLPGIWFTLAFVCAAFLLALFRRYCLALLLLGITYGSCYGYWIYHAQLPLPLSGEIFFIEGVVVGIPSLKKGKRGQDIHQFFLQIHTIELENKEVLKNKEKLANKEILENKQTPEDKQESKQESKDTRVTVLWTNSLAEKMMGKKVSLSWYGAPLKNKKIKAGDYWRLKVKLKRPRGFVNPNGFDYQLYLLQQNIMATGYVKKSHQNDRINNRCDLFFIDCWRNYLHDYFSALYYDQPMLGPLLGLLIGERQLITADQWDTVKETGTVHLFAISGLHVGLAALFGMLVGYVFVRIYQFLFNDHLTILPSVLSILFAVIYSCLAGLSLPTQRALIVVITFHCMRMIDRKVGAWFFISMALLGIALLDPLSIRSQGFYLSFAAVAVLLWSFSGYLTPVAATHLKTGMARKSNVLWLKTVCKKILMWIYTATKSQWVITIGLLLPSFIVLQGVSISSPLANFFAVPVVSFIVVPLLFISLLLLPLSDTGSQWLADLSLISLGYLFEWLYFFQKNTLGFWYFAAGELSWLAMLVVLVGLIGLLAPRGIPIKSVCLICFLPLFFPAKHRPPLRVTFLDVGQGTSVVIETDSHQLVYDTGQRFSDRFDAGKHIIAPYLMSRGYRSVDSVIVSHGDSDHAGGLLGLRSIISVGQQLSGEPDKTQGLQCQSGQRWQWDAVKFTVLWPTEAYLEENRKKGKKNRKKGKSNNLSCVLLIQYQDKNLLLAGDIEREVEVQLLASGQLPSSIDILLVPHHGSRTSSHSQWVSLLKPQYAVVTAGYRNAYGHPDPEVSYRYQQVGSTVFNTGEEGAIRFLANDNDKRWTIERWRTTYPRYWYD